MKLMWGAEPVDLNKRFPKDTYSQGQTEDGVRLMMRRDERNVFVLVVRFDMQQAKFFGEDPQRAVDDDHHWATTTRKGKAWMGPKSKRYQEQHDQEQAFR